MSWTEQYKNKIVSPEKAVMAINSGDRIFLTGNCSVPRTILSALVDRATELSDVEINQALTIGSADYVSPEMEGHIRVNTMFISHNTRAAIHEGRADFTPVLLSEFPLLFKNRILPLNAAFVHLSPPDEHGFCSFGVEVGLSKSAAESADIIIAEINEQMPRTLGDSFIHVNRLNYIVPVDYDLPELPMGGDDENQVVQNIAEYIADLIPDGATMQMGIGAIPVV